MSDPSETAGEETRVPTDFRRVTMLVHNMDEALQLYRDILGMTVYYDQELTVSGQGLPAGEPNAGARLVILQCNDPYIGMLGILQYTDPPLPAPVPRPEPNRVRAGEVVFVMHNDDVDAAFEAIRTLAGVEVVSEPHVTEYPKDDGSVFRVKGISFFDPNGYFIELNQWV